MKSFLKMLLIMPLIIAPLACAQQDGGQDDGDGVTLTETNPIPPVTEVDNPDLVFSAATNVYTTEEALNIIQELQAIDGHENLYASLAAAGYEYSNIWALIPAIKKGEFPPKFVDAKLIVFLRHFDHDLKEKLTNWQSLVAEEDALQTDLYYAELHATTRLVQLLDILYREEITTREAGVQFSVGTVQYHWEMHENGLLVSH